MKGAWGWASSVNRWLGRQNFLLDPEYNRFESHGFLFRRPISDKPMKVFSGNHACFSVSFPFLQTPIKAVPQSASEVQLLSPLIPICWWFIFCYSSQ